ncbi:ParM/StbA family protein [Aquibacillus rhizosphaerae]|uniref:ParM/StbA family protein n=1 Tax=Aquibacillus rhizosphaerae TaxID=3051431 RepID=A0ABT7L3A9_9BACI|nr:ParM/StbA family protein [Aquibacillus sp. LR5S19]MDL4840346.1 ParM/StbA family protein [Aquibacillus sp. LR5S19]
MKEQILIAIDCGKSNSKALAKYKGNTYTTTFPTRMQQVKRFGVEIQPNSYLVEFNGDEFLLGEMVSESYSDFNLNKNSLIHKIAIYTAITRLLQKANAPSNVDIRLAVNVPITTYKDSIQKRNFKSMVENENRTIHLIVNGKAFSFDLSDVTIAFEGMGEVYAKPEKYRKGYTTVIDVGGLNCTFCQFKGVQPMVNTMISSDLGINILKGKIGKYINERYGLSVSSDDLEHVLRCGYFASKGEIFEESKVFIEELKYDHLQQIVQFAKSRGYTFNMSDIHFVGGGSITLRRYIKQLFSHAVIIDNPLYSNCLSFLKILEVKYA